MLVCGAGAGPVRSDDPSVVELDVHPEEDTWYTLTARNLAGSSTKRLKLSIVPETTAPPKLDFFVATPTSVEQGETAALTFSAQKADTILLRDGSGRVIVQRDTSGSPSVLQTINIAPDQSGVYALTLTNAGGEITQAVTVIVRPAPPPPPEPTPTPGPQEAPPG